MTTVLLACIVVGVLILGAGAGATAAIYVVLFSTRGERGRFNAELAPIQEAIGELSDRFDHFYKRNRKRERDASAESPAEEPTLLSRAERLAALRARRLGEQPGLPKIGRSGA